MLLTLKLKREKYILRRTFMIRKREYKKSFLVNISSNNYVSQLWKSHTEKKNNISPNPSTKTLNGSKFSIIVITKSLLINNMREKRLIHILNQLIILWIKRN